MKKANSVFAMTLLVIVIYIVGFSKRDAPGTKKENQEVEVKDTLGKSESQKVRKSVNF